MAAETVKGCIFDLDGVLVDTAKYHYQSWIKLAEFLGFELGNQLEEALKGINRMASLEKVLTFGNIKATQAEKLRYADLKNQWFLDSLQDLENSVILPSVIEFLEQVKELNIKIGLGSASKNANRIIRLLSMDKYFTTMIDANMVKNTKPNPEVFINAARDLQLLEAECLVFEDSIEGIKAARKGGFRTIGVGAKEILSTANFNIENFAEYTFKEILVKIESKPQQN